MLYLQFQQSFQQKSEQEQFKIHLSLVIALIGGFAGAFLFDAFSQGVAITFNNLNKIGLTFFGGLLSGLFLLIISLRLLSIPVLPTLNLLAQPFCIAHIFGRLGCFMAGCCFGSPTSSITGVVFPTDSLPHQHYHELIRIHPTQLYESAFVLLVFIFLITSKYKHPFYFYIIAYSVFRFLVEFLRSDNRGLILHQDLFSPSQVISLATILVCTGLLLISFLKKQQNPSL